MALITKPHTSTTNTVHEARQFALPIVSLGAIVVLLVIKRYRKPHAVPEIDPDVLERINKDMAKLD